MLNLSDKKVAPTDSPSQFERTLVAKEDNQRIVAERSSAQPSALAQKLVTLYMGDRRSNSLSTVDDTSRQLSPWHSSSLSPRTPLPGTDRLSHNDDNTDLKPVLSLSDLSKQLKHFKVVDGDIAEGSPRKTPTPRSRLRTSSLSGSISGASEGASEGATISERTSV